MSRNRTIIDCYTDEPAGLGVPPYLGVWPRYVAGRYKQIPTYLTIDDLRVAHYKRKHKDDSFDPPNGRTKIKFINHTRNRDEIRHILKRTDQVTVIAGVHTPGKYLTGKPGTLKEIKKLLSFYKFRKILVGPVVGFGTQFRGGGVPELPEYGYFDEIRELGGNTYDKKQPVFLKGAEILNQIPQERIIEIETGTGCIRERGCSFCTEPLKNRLHWRQPQQIIEEVRLFQKLGARASRLGKQSCIYSYQNGDVKKLKELLSGLAKLEPDVLHIDNANPVMVNEERTRLFVKYLTGGSTAAMGIESFDPKVIKLNNLNSSKEEAFEAIRIINRVGGQRGQNGIPKLLPGINILLGLEGETSETLEMNYLALKALLDENLLIRRINIRQVVPFPGTRLYERTGNKFLRKNRRLYSRWIEKVRHEIDLPMLQKLFPKGVILRNLKSEIHDGKVTFMRQIGSYPIIVGIERRLPLGQFFDVRIKGHMLRSLVGEIV